MGTQHPLNVIGKPVNKVDGKELVTGKARFTADMKFPGMVHAYQFRAGVPAAKLLAIDTEKARQSEGVLDVLTADDIPGPNLIGILPPFDQPVMADEEIRYAGETLALVVAKTREQARQGALKISPSFKVLNPVLTIDDALKENARKIHPQGNITFSKELIKGDAHKGLEDADVVVTGTYETSFQEHAYIEPEAVCAVPDGDNRITIYASCQSPFHLRGHIANNLGVPAARVKVVQAYTGGSFGGKDDVAVEIGILAGTAALKLGRPVMISHDREESIKGCNVRHAARIEYTTGAKKDGTLTARVVKVFLDGGAYASESPFVSMKALIHAAGPYVVDNVFVEVTTVYTNKIGRASCRERV